MDEVDDYGMETIVTYGFDQTFLILYLSNLVPLKTSSPPGFTTLPCVGIMERSGSSGEYVMPKTQYRS